MTTREVQPSAQSIQTKLPLTIADLKDRSSMLQDVRAKVSFFKRDLAALLLSLPEE